MKWLRRRRAMRRCDREMDRIEADLREIGSAITRIADVFSVELPR